MQACCCGDTSHIAEIVPVREDPEPHSSADVRLSAPGARGSRCRRKVEAAMHLCCAYLHHAAAVAGSCQALHLKVMES